MVPGIISKTLVPHYKNAYRDTGNMTLSAVDLTKQKTLETALSRLSLRFWENCRQKVQISLGEGMSELCACAEGRGPLQGLLSSLAKLVSPCLQVFYVPGNHTWTLLETCQP